MGRAFRVTDGKARLNPPSRHVLETMMLFDGHDRNHAHAHHRSFPTRANARFKRSRSDDGFSSNEDEANDSSTRSFSFMPKR